MDKKIAIPLYAEHLHLLMTRCDWRVSNVGAHYNFEQSKFKKDFVIMNQVSRLQEKTDIERDFYRFMNNSNFAFDSRNNAESCFFLTQYLMK